MAWITEREHDFLVRWRDAESRKTKSRSIRWNDRDGDFAVSKEDARRAADALAERKRQTELAYRKPLERVIEHNRQDYPGWQPDFIGLGEDTEEYRFQNYLETIIKRDDIRESSKATYLHSLRNHIDGTRLGRKNIRYAGRKQGRPNSEPTRRQLTLAGEGQRGSLRGEECPPLGRRTRTNGRSGVLSGLSLLSRG
jgi:hypothetical protein